MDLKGKATKADGGASNGIAETVDGSKVDQPRVSEQSAPSKEESVSSEHPSLSRESAASQSRLNDQVPLVSSSNLIRDEQPKGNFNKLQGVNKAEDGQNQDKGESRLSEGEKDTKTGNGQPPTAISSGQQMYIDQKGDAIKEGPHKSKLEMSEEIVEEDSSSPPSKSHTTDAIVTHCTAALIGQSNVIDHINMVSSEKQMAKSSAPLPLEMGTEIALGKEILDKGGSAPIEDETSKAKVDHQAEEDGDDKDKSTEKSEKATKGRKESGEKEPAVGKNESEGKMDHQGAAKLEKSSDDDTAESVPKSDHREKEKVEKAEKSPSPAEKSQKLEPQAVKETKNGKLEKETDAKSDHQERQADQGKGDDIKDVSTEKKQKIEEEDKKESNSEKLDIEKGKVASSDDHREKDKGDESVGKPTEEKPAERDSSVISEKKVETKPSAKMDQGDPCHSGNAKNVPDLPEFVKMGISDGNIEIQESTIHDAKTIPEKSHKDDVGKNAIGGSGNEKIHKDKSEKDRAVDIANVAIKDEVKEVKAENIDVEKMAKAGVRPSKSDKTESETKKKEEKSPKSDKELVPQDKSILTKLVERMPKTTDISDKSNLDEKELKIGTHIEQQRAISEMEPNNGLSESAKDGVEEKHEAISEKSVVEDKIIADKNVDDKKIEKIISENIETATDGKEISEISSCLTDDVKMGVGRSTPDKTESSKDVQVESMDEVATSASKKDVEKQIEIPKDEHDIKDKKTNGKISEREEDVVTKAGDDVTLDDGMQKMNADADEKKSADEIPGKLIAVESDVNLVNGSLETAINNPAAVPKVPSESIDSAGKDKVSSEMKIEDGVSLTTPSEIVEKDRKDSKSEVKDKIEPSKDKDSRKKSGTRKGESDTEELGEEADGKGLEEIRPDEQNLETKISEFSNVNDEDKIADNEALVSDDMAVQDVELVSLEDAGQQQPTEVAIENASEMDEKQSPEKIDADHTELEEKQNDEKNVAEEVNIEEAAEKEGEGLAGHVHEEISEVKGEKVEDNEKVEMLEENEKVEDGEKVEILEENEKLEGNEKVEKVEDNEKVEKLEDNEKVEKVEDNEKVEILEKNEKVEDDEKVEDGEKVEIMEDNEKVEDDEKVEDGEKVEIVEDNEKVEILEENEKVEDDEKAENSIGETEKQAEETRDQSEIAKVKIEEEHGRAGAKNKDGDHDSGVDETTQRKKTPPSAKGTSTALAPAPAPAPSSAKKAVSPTTATASPAKTQKTPNTTPKVSTTPAPSLPEKKLPMNKIVVGTSPSPNLKVVRSKIGSFENVKHKAGGGQVKVETKKIDLANVKSRIGSTDNIQHKPTGGEKKILSRKLEWKAQSKVGSMDNATHKPGGGNKKIEVQKLEFKDKAKPKVGSKDNIQHKAGGGELKIEEHKLKFKESAQSKVGSMDYVKHQPGGGNIQIFDEKFYHKQQRDSSKKSSLTNSDEHFSDNRTPSPSASVPHLQQPVDPEPVLNSSTTPVQDVAHTNGDSPLPGVELAGKQ